MVEFHKLDGPRRSDELPSTYGTGRVCAVDGCETKLSRYNRDDRCAMHQAEDAAPVKRRRRRPQWKEIEDRLAERSE